MKTIIAAFLLLTSACFGQAIASRRYAEKTPLQLTFGSFTSVAPYNEANGYTLVPDAQIQPANGLLNNNQCASTSDFTVIQNTDSPTFTAASGVCTVTTGSGSGQTFKIGSTASSFSAPDVFVQVPITQNGSGGTDIIGAGLYRADGTVELDAQVNVGFSGVTVTAYASGTFADLCSAGLTIPTAPWTLGFSLVGAQGTAWYNTGTGWKMLCTADFSSKYDPRTAGLSGFQAGVKVFTSVATTWKFSSVKSGLFGGTGVRDISAVVYPDGRPYMRGSVAYFLATLGGVSGGAVDSPNGVFSYDLVSGALTFLGNIASNRNSGIFEDSAGQIIYDPATNTERLFISTWGTSTSVTPTIVYASQSITVDDWLAVGVHIPPAMTMMTIPGSTYTYDPNVNCVNWNYSSSTCGKWLMATASASGAIFGEPLLLSSTSDPSANSWTSIMADSVNEGYEGSRLIRTPTTYLGSGVAYTGCFAGVVGSATRSSRCYDMAGTYLGALNVTWPPALGSDNPPHAIVIEYGGKAYLVTFNDNSFKTISQTMGNWIVATAPEY